MTEHVGLDGGPKIIQLVMHSHIREYVATCLEEIGLELVQISRESHEELETYVCTLKRGLSEPEAVVEAREILRARRQ